MRYVIIVFLLLLVSGCGNGISNEEIVEQARYCNENGMRAVVLYGGLSFEPVRVMCSPKED